tara:strand:- start:1544 stop:2050 length:507 start_codon:yes stop_codon:yes gene_type:complete
MLKIVIANRPSVKGDSTLASAINKSFNLECQILNVPSEILYETFKLIQPDIYILNKGYEGYEGLVLVKKIKAYNPKVIVIMISADGSPVIHPNLENISLDKVPQVKNINRLMAIHNRIKTQTKPGLKFYERKWCFYRMNISDVFFLLTNLISNSSLPKANQRILATAI